jgi:excinuclease UvrABC nuclease subunit
VLDFDCGLEFDPSREEEFFAALPPLKAVCLIEPREAFAAPFLIRTANLRRRLQRLLGPPDPSSKRLNLRPFVRGVRYRLSASPFDQSLTYYVQARALFPHRYRKLLRLRAPTVLKISLRAEYPRCYPTRRVAVDAAGVPTGGVYFGPFPSRKSAESFSEGMMDFFKVRRCQIKIRRDPEFPGCIYSEMKMCLAPCFAGCTKEEYDAEVHRLVQFVETNGGSLRSNFEEEREHASEELDFEKAAAMHKKLEKLDGVLRSRDDLVRRIQDINAVILQRGAGEGNIEGYRVSGTRICQPFTLNFTQIASQPRSAEQLFREHLESIDPAFVPGELEEHLWLVSRWFYSNPREGEIFFREKDWPYRKILRACARLLQPGEESAGDDSKANGKATASDGSAKQT